jgi:hypothetical protein
VLYHKLVKELRVVVSPDGNGVKIAAVGMPTVEERNRLVCDSAAFVIKRVSQQINAESKKDVR